MCIHCETRTDMMPASVTLRADGSDFYCMACETDGSEDIGQHVMHSQDGECRVLGQTGDTYHLAPVSGLTPFRANACEVEPV